MVLGFYFYNQNNYNRTHGYNAENQSLIKMAYDNRHNYVGSAFEALQSQFRYPRQIDLHSYVAKDTNLAFKDASKQVQLVYFFYSLADDKRSNQYFSKVYMADLIPELVFFNDIIAINNKEYQVAKELIAEKETLKSGKFFIPLSKKQVDRKISKSSIDTSAINQALYYYDSLKLNQ